MGHASKRAGLRAALLAICATSALVALPASSHAATKPDSCVGTFEGSFTAGRLQGLSLNGTLTYQVTARGKLTGLLADIRERGHAHKVALVSGSVGKHKVHLRFTTAKGLVVTGTGAARGVRGCSSRLGGKLTSAGNGTGRWKGRTEEPVYIPAPSFYYLCGGNDASTILFNDGRIYVCSMRAFQIPPSQR
jgi:hypothetical protein